MSKFFFFKEKYYCITQVIVSLNLLSKTFFFFFDIEKKGLRTMSNTWKKETEKKYGFKSSSKAFFEGDLSKRKFCCRCNAWVTGNTKCDKCNHCFSSEKSCVKDCGITLNLWIKK